jgi:hypothetical protein
MASLDNTDIFSHEPLTISRAIAEQYMRRNQEATEFLLGGGQFESMAEVEVHMSHWEERPKDSDPLLSDVVLGDRHRRFPLSTYFALNDDVCVLADGVRINRLGIGFSLLVSSKETYQDGEHVFQDMYALSPDDITLLLKEQLSFMT